MHVLMRIDVRRIGTDQLPERVELSPDLNSGGCRVIRRHDSIEHFPLAARVDPFAEIHVQAEG